MKTCIDRRPSGDLWITFLLSGDEVQDATPIGIPGPGRARTIESPRDTPAIDVLKTLATIEAGRPMIIISDPAAGMKMIRTHVRGLPS